MFLCRMMLKFVWRPNGDVKSDDDDVIPANIKYCCEIIFVIRCYYLSPLDIFVVFLINIETFLFKFNEVFTTKLIIS